MSTETTDPYVRIATELGRLGHRLDGMGAELLELRASTGPVGPGPAVGSAGASQTEDARPAVEVASGDRPDSEGPAGSGPAGHGRASGTPNSAGRAGSTPARPGGSAGSAGDGVGYSGPAGQGGVAGPAGYPDSSGYPRPAGQAGYAGPAGYPGQPSSSGQAGNPGGGGYAGPAGYPGQGYPGSYPGPAGPGGWAGGTSGPEGVYSSARPARRPFSALSGARLLAWTGAAVTLLGVALLLALAASRGWFSPPTRIAAGAVLGVALVGVAVWLHRRETARIGALALAATGFATLYLVVAAATAVYDYLDAPPALLIALLVAAGGLGLADRWRSELLAGGVVVGAAVLAPVLTTDWLLVALVLALQLAALPVVLRRRWSVLLLVAAAGPVLFGSVVGAFEGADGAATTIAVALGALAVGLGTAAPAARLLPRVPVAVLVAAVPLPVVVTGTALGGWTGGGLVAVAAAALAALAAVPGTDRVVRIVAGTAAAVALFQATAVALDGAAGTIVLLGEAIVGAMLAASLRSRLALIISMVFGAFGVLIAIGRDAPLAALVVFPSSPYAEDGTSSLITGAAVSALVLALAVALLVAGGRVGLIRPDAASARLWVPIGLAGLYGATSLAVTLALLVSPDRAGFTAGHALVTVSWTVAALVLLARGLTRPALRITGLVLVAAAVAKLVLFDLVALDGLARVAAFLGAGLVLLVAGTRYARLVAEAEAEADAEADADATPPAGIAADPARTARPAEGPPPR